MNVNQATLAGILGLTTRQVRNLERDGLPVEAVGNRKRYDLPAAVRFYVTVKMQEATRAASPDDLQRARARKAEVDARLRELDLERTLGELVPLDEMANTFESSCAVIAAHIQALPGRFAHVVNPAEPPVGQDGLERVVEELLASLSTAFDETGRQPDGLLLEAI